MLWEQIQPDESIAIFRIIRKGEAQITQVRKREEGFRDYLTEKGYGGRIYTVQLPADEPEENCMAIQEFCNQHPEISTGIIFNSKAHRICRKLELSGKPFRLIGYDTIDDNVHYLKAGSITHLIAQRPEVQGFNCIRALFRHLVLDEKVDLINYMPIDILMKENINYYNNYI